MASSPVPGGRKASSWFTELEDVAAVLPRARSTDALQSSSLSRDDGDGFPLQEEGSDFGIRGMKRRANSIDASLRIRTSPGHGASVQFSKS
jgi:signal transduction histidine kinase